MDRKEKTTSECCRDFYVFPFFLLMEFYDLCFGDPEGAGLVAEALCYDSTWELNLQQL